MFLGLKSFRSGIRKNNSKFMLAGRQAVAPLMFIGKHRIYQHIIVRDLQIRYQFLCFYTVVLFVQEFTSLNTSSSDNVINTGLP